MNDLWADCLHITWLNEHLSALFTASFNQLTDKLSDWSCVWAEGRPSVTNCSAQYRQPVWGSRGWNSKQMHYQRLCNQLLADSFCEQHSQFFFWTMNTWMDWTTEERTWHIRFCLALFSSFWPMKDINTHTVQWEEGGASGWSWRHMKLMTTVKNVGSCSHRLAWHLKAFVGKDLWKTSSLHVVPLKHHSKWGNAFYSSAGTYWVVSISEFEMTGFNAPIFEMEI